MEAAGGAWKIGVPWTWNGADATGVGWTGVPVRERLWIVRAELWFLRGNVGCCLIRGISNECSSLNCFLGFLYLGSSCNFSLVIGQGMVSPRS